MTDSILAVLSIHNNAVLVVGYESTTGDLGVVPVQNDSLRCICHLTAADSQCAALTILYGVEATAEAAAVNGQRSVGVIVAVAHEAGIAADSCFAAGRGNSCTAVDSQAALIVNGVIRVTAVSIGGESTGFLTAVKGTAVEGSRSVVEQCCAGMRYVINSAASDTVNNGQIAVVYDRVLFVAVGKCLAVQIDGNGLAGRNGNGTGKIVAKLNGLAV